MNLSSTSQKFQDHLNKLCPDLKVVEYSQGARTAEDAAKAIGCKVGQIAKSLVFKGTNTGKPYIFIVSGPNRLNEQKMTDVVGEEIEKADADFSLKRKQVILLAAFLLLPIRKILIPIWIKIY